MNYKEFTHTVLFNISNENLIIDTGEFSLKLLDKNFKGDPDSLSKKDITTYTVIAILLIDNKSGAHLTCLNDQLEFDEYLSKMEHKLKLDSNKNFREYLKVIDYLRSVQRNVKLNEFLI